MLDLHARHNAAYLGRAVGNSGGAGFLSSRSIPSGLSSLGAPRIQVEESAWQGAGLRERLSPRHLNILRIYLLHKAAHFASQALAVAEARLCIAEGHLPLGACHGHIEQSTLLFQLGACGGQERGKQLFLHADHINIGELQALGGVDGHQTYLVGVLVLVFVLASVEQHLLQERVEGF